jgi:hypothetical protein
MNNYNNNINNHKIDETGELLNYVVIRRPCVAWQKIHLYQAEIVTKQQIYLTILALNTAG